MRKKLFILFSLILVIGVIVTSVFLNKAYVSRNKEFNLISAETENLKALAYGEFEEGSDAVEGTDNVKFTAAF